MLLRYFGSFDCSAAVIKAIVLENLALRQHLAIYKRKKKRPHLLRRDLWFWMVLARLWKGWRKAPFVVHLE
jgi:hypothetical protein